MGDSESESEAPRVKLRPIVRLGMFLISHSHLLSVVCCTAGVLTLLLLPLLAKNTYISENALMPGSANPMLSSQEVSEANGLVKDLTNLDLKPMASGMLKNDGGSDIRSFIMPCGDLVLSLFLGKAFGVRRHHGGFPSLFGWLRGEDSHW